MSLTTRIADKTGLVGSIVSGMGCTLCFPALASIGAAIGLGFLSQWESLLVHILLPLFAIVALLANGLGWFSHRQWHRSVLGMIGPVLALIGAYRMTGAILYPGLVLMFAIAVWDLVSPPRRRCSPGDAGTPIKNDSRLTGFPK